MQKPDSTRVYFALKGSVMVTTFGLHLRAPVGEKTTLCKRFAFGWGQAHRGSLECKSTAMLVPVVNHRLQVT